MKKSSKSGPQGPVSKNTQSLAKSQKNTKQASMVHGTSTNPQGTIRSLTPKAKKR